MREVIKGKVHRVYKPVNDDEFLDQVSFIVFIIGFNYAVVRQRWPEISRAFKNFSVSRVAAMDAEKLLDAKGMIRNRRKIAAVIENAKLCLALQKQHGSVLKWVAKLKTSYEKDPLLSPSLKEEFQRFRGIGKTTSGWLDSIH